MNLSRREMLATLAGGVALAAKTRALDVSAAPAAGAIHHSVCRWTFKEIPLEELAQAVKPMGVTSIELLDPPDWPVVRKYGLTCAMANYPKPMSIKSGLNRIEHHAEQVPAMIQRIKEVADAGLPNVICFSGSREGMPDEQGLENCVKGLQGFIGEAEKRKVTVCMELLNSKVNHKDYMCDHTAWGVELAKRVGSERFKLLYDIYHMQIMEGDVIRTITDNHRYIGHFHTGGVPGRHEIDETQELNYPAIMRAIKATGYTGFVSQEFVPSRTPHLESLRQAIQICTV